MADSILDRALYSYADVDRLFGPRHGTARRWLEGYGRAGRFYDPVLRPGPTGGDAVTWGEMVEARLLAEFRSRDVPVQRFRPAIVRLRKEFGPYPSHMLVRSSTSRVASSRESSKRASSP